MKEITLWVEQAQGPARTHKHMHTYTRASRTQTDTIPELEPIQLRFSAFDLLISPGDSNIQPWFRTTGLKAVVSDSSLRTHLTNALKMWTTPDVPPIPEG